MNVPQTQSEYDQTIDDLAERVANTYDPDGDMYPADILDDVVYDSEYWDTLEYALAALNYTHNGPVEPLHWTDTVVGMADPWKEVVTTLGSVSVRNDVHERLVDSYDIDDDMLL